MSEVIIIHMYITVFLDRPGGYICNNWSPLKKEYSNFTPTVGLITMWSL